MVPEPGLPYTCNACGVMMLGPHYSSADCPATGDTPAAEPPPSRFDTSPVIRYLCERAGWTDEGEDGPGWYPPVRKDPHA